MCIQQFQSTLPRGERHGQNIFADIKLYFNPRSREGSDGYTVIPTKRDHVISIHAPARGATYYKGGKTKYKKISIHAPARGATEIEDEE